MKRRIIKRVQRTKPPVHETMSTEFYEAMPTTAAEPVYREGPVFREEASEHDQLFSGWAIVGLIMLALVILLLFVGRSSLSPAINRSGSSGTNEAPVTNTPVNTPAAR